MVLRVWGNLGRTWDKSYFAFRQFGQRQRFNLPARRERLELDEHALDRAELVNSLPPKDRDFNKICTTETLRGNGLIPQGDVQLVDPLYQDAIKARRRQFKSGIQFIS